MRAEKYLSVDQVDGFGGRRWYIMCPKEKRKRRALSWDSTLDDQ
jgi:hypothetical protein